MIEQLAGVLARMKIRLCAERRPDAKDTAPERLDPRDAETRELA
jgi:hypothetical protein